MWSIGHGVMDFVGQTIRHNHISLCHGGTRQWMTVKLSAPRGGRDEKGLYIRCWLLISYDVPSRRPPISLMPRLLALAEGWMIKSVQRYTKKIGWENFK